MLQWLVCWNMLWNQDFSSATGLLYWFVSTLHLAEQHRDFFSDSKRNLAEIPQSSAGASILCALY